MVVPETKDGSSTKYSIEAAVPTEKVDANKSAPHKPKVLARQHNDYERAGREHAGLCRSIPERATASIRQLVTAYPSAGLSLPHKRASSHAQGGREKPSRVGFQHYSCNRQIRHYSCDKGSSIVGKWAGL
jgi:hypothetical protein